MALNIDTIGEIGAVAAYVRLSEPVAKYKPVTELKGLINDGEFVSFVSERPTEYALPPETPNKLSGGNCLDDNSFRVPSTKEISATSYLLVGETYGVTPRVQVAGPVLVPL